MDQSGKGRGQDQRQIQHHSDETAAALVHLHGDLLDIDVHLLRNDSFYLHYINDGSSGLFGSQATPAYGDTTRTFLQ